MSNSSPEKPDPHMPKPPTDNSGRIGGWMIALLWLLMLGGGTLLANQWIKGRNADRAPAWSSTNDGEPVLILKEDRYNQYTIIGSANNSPVEFLLDTGASQISIPESVAKRLNLRRGQSYPVETANGRVTVYATTLDEVSLGPFQLRDVRAHINPGMRGDMALLGMSFLRHFEMIQRSGVLTISVP